MFISNLSIKRPVFATVLMLALVTLGWASYRRLAIDFFPNIEIPVISIVTLLPGGSPESIERDVTRRIEEAVNPIAGVKHVGSTSREGVSQVYVEFDLEVDPDQAAQDARTKIAAIRGEMPASIQDPIIEKLDFGGIPIVSLAVRSEALSPRDLTTLVETRVKRRLENVLGVGKIDLVGPVTREINVEINPDRLEALSLSVEEVIAGLRSENIDTPLGRMTGTGTEVPLRVQGKAQNVADFQSMIIATRGGRPIRLDEVATVTDGIEEVRSLAYIDGVPAVALDVLKQTGANSVGVADAIRSEIEALQPELPPGTRIELVRDGSTFIREAVADVQETLVLGGLLTVLIVFIFLNSWRSTVITGLTLPISVISAFIVMNFAGMTLNVMTLMALSLAIGLLIDDAIVVRENIVRHLEHGEDHFEAARSGTSEIGLAVLATTCSILAVFIPVAFMKGIVGRFFFAFGITVSFAVAVSLLVSFTLDPMLSSRWIDPDIARVGRRRFLSRVLDRFNAGFERVADGYRGVIAWALDHRPTVATIAVLAFVAGLFGLSRMESEFFPQYDQGEFTVSFKTAPDASIDETRDRLDAVLKTLRELPEIEQTYASIGAGDAGTVRDGRVYVKLTELRSRARRQAEIQRDVRARLQVIPGIIPSLGLAHSFDNRKPLLVNVRGENIDQLKSYAQRLKDELYGVPGVVDLEASLEHETPEYRLIVDRERAADLGLTTSAIAGTVSALVGGQAVTTFEDEEGESRDVRVRLPASLRQNPTQVEALRLPLRRGDALATLGSIARYELSTTPSEINRRDLSREVVVGANLDGLPLGTAVATIRDLEPRLALAPGYGVMVTGENEAMEESFGYMGEALILAIVFVYLILAAQFESFVHPLAIMLSLPLSIIGVAVMLLLTGDTVNMMSLIGLIMLMGLVTKNAILLVDFTNVLRGRGLDRRAAVIQAGRTRLRPIVMTTCAMIFGMLPLAIGFGSGGEMRAPLARAVIGGLITSTLLTLIVIPVVYTLLDDLAGAVRRRRAAAVAARAAAVALLLSLVFPASAAARQPSLAAAQLSPTAAGQQAAAGRVLTLEEALALAAAQNRDVAKAREYQKWIEGKYLEERSAALPDVTFSTSALRQFDNTQSKLFSGFSFGDDSDSGGADLREIFGGRQDVRVAELRVTQPVFTWGQVGAAIRAARVGFRYADAQLRRFQQGVARDVSAAYHDVVVAKALVGIAAEDIAQKQRHLDETRRKVTLGAATDYDVLAAEVAVENARPALIRGENAVRSSRERLRWLLAEGAALDVAPPPALVLEPVPAYEDVLARALQNRPELAELAYQRDIYREFISIEQAAGRPRVDFTAGFGKRQLGLPSISSTGTSWTAGLFATVPLFDGMRTRGRVAQARTDLSRASIDELKARDGVALEVRTAVDAVREATELVNALAGTIRQAEKLVFLAEKGFELGVKTRLDVQDAQLNLVLAKGNLARAERDYRVARVNLEWVAGTLALTP
ncbi:MAG TPA: efflux RND transporter permease subunit [Vicinamibacterales bacterium]|nr:efflux RND transporter permease subunit [Vicinamibacterales bacterium]